MPGRVCTAPFFTLMQWRSTVTAGWGNTSQSARSSQVTGIKISRLDARKNRSTVQQPFSAVAPPRAPSAQDGYTSESLGEARLTWATKTQALWDTPVCTPQAANREGKRTKFSFPRSRGKVQKGWFSFLLFFFLKALASFFTYRTTFKKCSQHFPPI